MISEMLVARRPILPFGSLTALWMMITFRLSMYVLGTLMGLPVSLCISLSTAEAWYVAIQEWPVCIA